MFKEQCLCRRNWRSINGAIPALLPPSVSPGVRAPRPQQHAGPASSSAGRDPLAPLPSLGVPAAWLRVSPQLKLLLGAQCPCLATTCSHVSFFRELMKEGHVRSRHPGFTAVLPAGQGLGGPGGLCGVPPVGRGPAFEKRQLLF